MQLQCKVIQGALRGEPPRAPRDLAKLLDLLYELCIDANGRVDDEAARVLERHPDRREDREAQGSSVGVTLSGRDKCLHSETDGRGHIFLTPSVSDRAFVSKHCLALQDIPEEPPGVTRLFVRDLLW